MANAGWYVAGAAVALIACVVWNARAKRLPGIATEAWIPFFGNFFHFARHSATYYDWISNLCNEKHRGKYVQTSMCFAPIVVHPPPSEANARWILKDNFNNYVVSERRIDLTAEVFGGGIFASNGPEWMRQRKAAANIFTLRLLRDGMCPVFMKDAKLVVDRLKAVAAEGGSLDLQDLFLRFTMQSFCEIAFGEDVGLLQSKEPHPFPKAFDHVQMAMTRRFFDPLWRVKRYLNVGREAGIKKQMSILNHHARLFVQHRREDIQSGRERQDLISHFLHAAKKEGRELSDQELRDIIVNFLVAGRDTTAIALSWLFHELSLNPEARKKVVQEIDSLMVDRNSIADFVTARDMVYTEAALLETLRLHPSVPVDGRIALRDDTLPDGTRIPAGTIVGYLPYVYGRSKELWGEDALQFKPERWLASAADRGRDDSGSGAADGGDDASGKADFNDSTHLTKHSQYKFPTFNGGPRLCMGRGLALLEAKLLTASVLSKFEFTIPQNQPPVHYAITFTNMLLNGLHLSPRLRA